MADTMSKEQRSRLMSLVRGKNTRFERAFLKLLSAAVYPIGYRYRKHCRTIFGTPDVAFVGYRIAIFLDSDFWHGKNYGTMRERLSPAWRAKIERNMARDTEVSRRLRREGWIVIRISEAEAKKRPRRGIARIVAALRRRSNVNP